MSTRKLIIEAASKVFAENGYKGMTIKLIADEVGIVPSAVYAFFKNKEDVFVQIYKEVLSGHFDIAEYYSSRFQDQPVHDQLYQLLRNLFAFHIRDRQQIRIFLRLLLFPPEVFREDLKGELMKLADMESALFAEVFDRGVRQGEVREGSSSAYAKAMILLMDGLFWQLQRYDDESAFWQEFEQSWAHFWQGIALRTDGS